MLACICLFAYGFGRVFVHRSCSLVGLFGVWLADGFCVFLFGETPKEEPSSAKHLTKQL